MRKSTCLCGLVMATACLPALLQAQQPGGSAAPAWATKQFNFEFTGGTLGEYVAALRLQTPELNVVVAEDVQDLRVQPLTLHNVVAPAALSTIDELLEPQIEIAPVAGPVEATTPIILVRRKGSPLQTAAFSVAFAKAEGAPNVMEAIEFAVEALPNHEQRPAPKLRLHDATGIMIVTADQEQLRLIAQVVELLGGESRLSLGAGQYSSEMSDPLATGRSTVPRAPSKTTR